MSAMMIDPLNPDLTTVTPAELLIDLSPAERRIRHDQLLRQSAHIVDMARITHLDGKRLAGVVTLLSGGNDSTVLAHLMTRRLRLTTHFGHANTGIGIPETTQFVRDVAARWGVPLLERHPPAGSTYDELVLEQGFPGPGHHYKIYQRLKERCLRQIRRELVLEPRRERVIFAAGRRRSESARRGSMRATGEHQVPLWERVDSVIWPSPLAMWTAQDLVTYRALAEADGDPVPFNPVTDHIGMSGECLCGCFAQPGELERLRAWYPAMAARIDALQQSVITKGFTGPRCQWGHGLNGSAMRVAEGRPAKPPKGGRLCSSCEFRAEQLEIDF